MRWTIRSDKIQRDFVKYTSRYAGNVCEFLMPFVGAIEGEEFIIHNLADAIVYVILYIDLF